MSKSPTVGSHTSMAVEQQSKMRTLAVLQDADLDWQMDAYAACNFQWFLKSGNLVLDFTQVGDALQTGVTHVRGVHDRMLDYVHKSYEFDLTAAVV